MINDNDAIDPITLRLENLIHRGLKRLAGEKQKVTVADYLRLLQMIADSAGPPENRNQVLWVDNWHDHDRLPEAA